MNKQTMGVSALKLCTDAFKDICKASEDKINQILYFDRNRKQELETSYLCSELHYFLTYIGKLSRSCHSVPTSRSIE